MAHRTWATAHDVPRKLMNKNTLFVAVTCLVIGFGIGFYWTNSLNRAVIKEAEDKIREARAGGGAGNQPTGTPGQPNGQMPSDDIHSGMANPQQVQQALDEAKKTRDNFEAQMKIGMYLYQGAKKFDEARECFEAALKLKPNDYDATVNLANVLFDASKFEEAGTWYEKAIKIKSDDVNVRTDLGFTYYLRKPQQLGKAIENYRLSLKLDPNHVPTLRNLAVALLENKEMAAAKEVTDQLAKVDPKNDIIPKLRAELEKAPGDTKREIPTH
ncbi:MAG: tetratricopeptide repeat protein [Blastocatellia bacterium]|nr:tetratricopeptide repeat protein [Blastocatellia bacterium]